MKKFLIKIIYLTLIFIAPKLAQARYIYVPFDESMQKIDAAPISEEYQLLKKIYEDHNPDKIVPMSEPIIPKIIHQIWLGPYKLPKEFMNYSKEWQDLHPNWQYKLWQEEDLDSLYFPDRDLYDKASSYQEKAEILKYTILKQFGGLYVDVDYKPIRRFDYLHYAYKFYGSILPPAKDSNEVRISTSILAAEPNSYIINKTLGEIRRVWEDVEKEFTRLSDKKKVEEIIKLYQMRSEDSFNRVVKHKISFMDRAIILPPTYLNIIIRNKLLDPYLETIGINKRERYFHIIHRETLAAERKDGTRLVKNLSQVEIKEGIIRRNYNKFKRIFLDFFHQFSY